MQLQVLSDLHFEFHPDHGRSFVERLDPEGVDVLAVAGDLEVGDRLVQALNILCAKYRDAVVVYVLGNHEFYGSAPEEVYDRVRAALVANPNLIWLDCCSAMLFGEGKKRILGATLWFPQEDFDPQDKASLTDFSAIEGFEPWVYEQNKRAMDFFKKELKPGDIVLTHHLPSYLCVAPQYKGSPLNPFFVCEMSDLIRERRPDLWMHGHSHASIWTVIGDTTVVCNPFGYMDSEPNPQFARQFTMSI